MQVPFTVSSFLGPVGQGLDPVAFHATGDLPLREGTANTKNKIGAAQVPLRAQPRATHKHVQAGLDGIMQPNAVKAVESGKEYFKGDLKILNGKFS